MCRSGRTKGHLSDKRRGAIEFDLSRQSPNRSQASTSICSATNNPDVNSTARLPIRKFTARSRDPRLLSPGTTWEPTPIPAPPGTPFDLEYVWPLQHRGKPAHSQYYSSGDASANDLIELNAMRTSSEEKLTLFLLNQSGSDLRDWGDAGHGGTAQLVLTTITEPSTIVLLATGLLGLLA